ncbi:hypothetical protein HDU87_001488 [Geranomyces variabilis]|uniref:Uncharacterized protein n=1 Tax=Geranomyces variabilis TaxID=109894 RepID=A0AAD5XLU0_9FUNG|nr:hypothetical protein HDU87_001488 [Geranomyces variabilis]
MYVVPCPRHKTKCMDLTLCSNLFFRTENNSSFPPVDFVTAYNTSLRCFQHAIDPNNAGSDSDESSEASGLVLTRNVAAKNAVPHIPVAGPLAAADTPSCAPLHAITNAATSVYGGSSQPSTAAGTEPQKSAGKMENYEAVQKQKGKRSANQAPPKPRATKKGKKTQGDEAGGPHDAQVAGPPTSSPLVSACDSTSRATTQATMTIPHTISSTPLPAAVNTPATATEPCHTASARCTELTAANEGVAARKYASQNSSAATETDKWLEPARISDPHGKAGLQELVTKEVGEGKAGDSVGSETDTDGLDVVSSWKEADSNSNTDSDLELDITPACGADSDGTYYVEDKSDNLGSDTDPEITISLDPHVVARANPDVEAELEGPFCPRADAISTNSMESIPTPARTDGELKVAAALSSLEYENAVLRAELERLKKENERLRQQPFTKADKLPSANDDPDPASDTDRDNASISPDRTFGDPDASWKKFLNQFRNEIADFFNELVETRGTDIGIYMSAYPPFCGSIANAVKRLSGRVTKNTSYHNCPWEFQHVTIRLALYRLYTAAKDGKVEGLTKHEFEKRFATARENGNKRCLTWKNLIVECECLHALVKTCGHGVIMKLATQFKKFTSLCKGKRKDSAGPFATSYLTILNSKKTSSDFKRLCGSNHPARPHALSNFDDVCNLFVSAMFEFMKALELSEDATVYQDRCKKAYIVIDAGQRTSFHGRNTDDIPRLLEEEKALYPPNSLP